ncbi:MAG: hypothetical protein ABFR05_08375 [Bacteroidota bacterium]
MIKKEIIIGFLTALVATLFGFYLYVEFVLPYEFKESLKIINEESLWGKVLGLAAIPNLLVFFVFLKKKQDYRAKGVLMETFFVAFLILISMFF